MTTPHRRTAAIVALVAAIQVGDSTALPRLAETFEAQARALAARYETSAIAADDLRSIAVQALDHAARALDLDEVRDPGAYLMTCARHAVTKAAQAAERVQQRETPTDLDDLDETLADAAPSPEALYLLAEQRHLLARALESLPAEQREVIEARYLRGMTAPETAEQVGCSLRTVWRRERAALASLRDALS